ncbi:MAG: site-2 protease family protein [Anaerolineaceae bacterium]|nr:site-2 protease family protein [Anaerolineaceae bacterium]
MMIIEFILIFGVLLFIHEFGHFIFAKLFKINVEEFGFGFPPRLLKIGKFRETEITLNWIPFGAFVRLSGENDPEVKGGFGDSSILARFMTLIGGPLFNLVLGVVLFAIIFMQVGIPDLKSVQVYGVNEGSPAEIAGISAGELIVEVNGVAITSTQQLSEQVELNRGKPITIKLRTSAGEEHIITATPRVEAPPGEGYLGVTLVNPYKEASVVEALPYAFRATGGYAVQLLALPGQLIKGTISPEEARPVGPVGIYSIYSQARERDETNADSANPEDRLNTLLILAIISVALGFTNLLPIPALDGGRLILLLPEIFLRKKVPAKVENIINMVGFAALIALMVIITTMDIINPVVMP